MALADDILAIRERWHTKRHPFFGAFAVSQAFAPALARTHAVDRIRLRVAEHDHRNVTVTRATGRDCAAVRPDVDRVGHQDGDDRGEEQPARVVAAQDASEAHAAHQAGGSTAQFCR